MAGVVGGGQPGIDMDRADQHVRPFPEDELRAVAVMHVDVDDRDLAEALGQLMGGDRGIVEVADPGHQVGIGVVPGRPAHAHRPARRRGQPLGAVDGDLGGGKDRGPGSGRDRAGGRVLVPAQLAQELGRLAMHPVRRMDIRDGNRAVAGVLGPARIDLSQELDIVRVVDLRDGLGAGSAPPRRSRAGPAARCRGRSGTAPPGPAGRSASGRTRRYTRPRPPC